MYWINSTEQLCSSCCFPRKQGQRVCFENMVEQRGRQAFVHEAWDRIGEYVEGLFGKNCCCGANILEIMLHNLLCFCGCNFTWEHQLKIVSLTGWFYGCKQTQKEMVG